MVEQIAAFFWAALELPAAVAYVMAWAVVLTASSVISKGLLAPSWPQQSPDPGSRQQLPPAGNNKIPVAYGQAYIGGIITDLSITANNQTLYYCIALSEVTGISSPDTITFGDIFWGGKKCTFDATDKTKVVSLTDISTGEVDTSIAGNLYFYLYANGSNSTSDKNANTSAITVMSDSSLVYKWDATKLMSNCAFAIIKINYNRDAGVTGLQQTKFQVTNSRNKPGDCIQDYLISTRYGAALPSYQVDAASLADLNSYSDEVITYTPYSGGSATQKRFEFDGTVDTNLTVMQKIGRAHV